MGKKLFLFLMVLVFISCTKEDEKFGLAKQLTGDVHVVCYFISDGNVHFTQKDKDLYLERLGIAEMWLKREASKTGTTIHFTNHLHSSYENTYNYTLNDNWDKIHPNEIYYDLYGSYNKAKEEIKKYGDNVVVIMFNPLNNRNCFCASHYYNHFNVIETVMMFKSWNYNYKERKSLEIAHEIMHAFGAVDLYNTSEFKTGYEPYYDSFSNSIMHTLSNNQYDVEVDELNQYLLGWTNESETWYKYFYNTSYY